MRHLVMRRARAASVLILVLVIAGGTRAQIQPEDSFLSDYYLDNETVLCRAYNTANGARFATYQWWVLRFVSGANHVNGAMKRSVPRVDVSRVLGLTSEHCQAHPGDTLSVAAIKVLERQNARRTGR